MSTVEQTSNVTTQAQPPVIPTQEPAQLNLVPPPTQAELEAAEAKLLAEQAKAKQLAIARFDTTTGFKLEAEIIGRAVKKTVSKSGAVKIAMEGRKQLSVQSGGLTGGDLDAWTRMRRDELKTKQSELAARMSGDNNWTGGEIVLSAKGDSITMKWKKAAPITVGLAEPTEEQAAAKLGLTLDELKAFRAMQEATKQAELRAKAQKEADEQAARELAAEEAALKESAASNGQVTADPENDGRE